MTSWGGWGPVIGYTAAALAIFGVLWRRILRPIGHGLRRALQLVDRLLEVLDAWPELSLNVETNGGDVARLALEVGQLGGQHSQTRSDVDAAFERIRELEATAIRRKKVSTPP